MDEDALIEEAIRMLPEIGRRLHACVAQHPLAAGRPIGQIKAMDELYRHRQRTVGELAAALGVSMPAASELVDRLVADGLAERGANPADRRQVVIGLTPTATAFGAWVHELRRAQLRNAFDRLAPAERPVLVRSLRALADALRADAEDGRVAPAHDVAVPVAAGRGATD